MKFEIHEKAYLIAIRLFLYPDEKINIISHDKKSANKLFNAVKYKLEVMNEYLK